MSRMDDPFLVGMLDGPGRPAKIIRRVFEAELVLVAVLGDLNTP